MYVISIRYNNTHVEEFRSESKPELIMTTLKGDWIGREPLFINWHEVKLMWIIEVVEKPVTEFETPNILNLGKFTDKS